VAKSLSNIFNVHGWPRILQSDNGKEFQGSVKRLLVQKNVRIVRSRPYHPESQGKVERCHRTLRRKIQYDMTQKRSAGSNWIEALPNICSAMNVDPREELGWQSPFKVYFGRPYNSTTEHAYDDYSDDETAISYSPNAVKKTNCA